MGHDSGDGLTFGLRCASRLFFLPLPPSFFFLTSLYLYSQPSFLPLLTAYRTSFPKNVFSSVRSAKWCWLTHNDVLIFCTNFWTQHLHFYDTTPPCCFISCAPWSENLVKYHDIRREILRWEGLLSYNFSSSSKQSLPQRLSPKTYTGEMDLTCLDGVLGKPPDTGQAGSQVRVSRKTQVRSRS